MACDQQCTCSTGNGTQGSLTGRSTRTPPRDYWPDHDRAPLTNFISERNRTALMWRL